MGVLSKTALRELSEELKTFLRRQDEPEKVYRDADPGAERLKINVFFRPDDYHDRE